MHLPRPGGVRTSEDMTLTTYPGYPALRVGEGPGSLSEQRWMSRDTRSILKPGPPSIHVHSPSASFTDGLRQHHSRLRSMPSRSRAATVAERPGVGAGHGFGQPAKLSQYDKRVSRDDTALASRQYGKTLAKPAFDNRMSRDDMSIASRTYMVYSGTKNPDKRMSRDDMALPTRQFDRSNYKSYHIPIRGHIPSPDGSPSQESLQGVTTVRTSTPESMDDSGGTGVIAIGMALGSPAHPPPMQPQQTVAMHNTASASTLDLHENQEDSQSKPKTRKWGFFGRSKSKRGRGVDATGQQTPVASPQLPQNHSILSPPVPPTPSTQTSNTAQEEPKRRKSLRRKPTITRLQKPPVPEIRTEPQPEPRLEPRIEPRVEPRQVPASIDLISASRLNTPGGPFLDVEIPSVEMERYSVMFGNVLNAQSSSSLLARRQATLDRVKTTREDLSIKPKESNQAVVDEWPRIRRATSPQPARTPSFTIFPSTPDRTGEIRGLSPKVRSRTSPAVLPSPAREMSSSGTRLQERVLPKPPSSREPERSDVVSRSVSVQKEQPRLVSKFNKQSPRITSPQTAETSSTFVESPTQIVQGGDGQVHVKSPPAFVEPSWEAKSPPHSATSPPNTIYRQTPQPSVSSLQTISRVSTDEDAEREKALQSAVEISIARQISVSRQQRTMLRPVQGSVRGRKDVRPNGVGMVPRVTMGRKGSTPTLVHLTTGEGEVPGRAIHRQSSRGIVEGI
ncbi:hypothetical protein HJFPF1_03173 [Paramyrothecium foliicola]|nr:hypothetical protein HJFPF1_03173 [Paramyrothecium foliicola]